jgi:hypothetical protein
MQVVAYHESWPLTETTARDGRGAGCRHSWPGGRRKDDMLQRSKELRLLEAYHIYLQQLLYHILYLILYSKLFSANCIE